MPSRQPRPVASSSAHDEKILRLRDAILAVSDTRGIAAELGRLSHHHDAETAELLTFYAGRASQLPSTSWSGIVGKAEALREFFPPPRELKGIDALTSSLINDILEVL